MSNKKILYIFFLILFISGLISLNYIVTFFSGEQQLRSVDLSNYKVSDEVHYYFERNEVLGGLFEKNYIQLWAFCETNFDNSHKQIDLIFESTSGKKAYAISSTGQLRHDVYSAFKDQLNIYNSLNGAEYNFATFSMKQGQYKLYIAVIENDTNFGIVDTGMVFEKDASGLHQLAAEN